MYRYLMVLMWCFINVHVFQQQEQVLSDLVDGKEIYNTIRRKTKDAFYKNIVKKGYLLFNKGTVEVWNCASGSEVYMH